MARTYRRPRDTETADQHDIATWVRHDGPQYWADTLGLGEDFAEQLERAIHQRQAAGRQRADRGHTDHPVRTL
jgi:hypothetical protein